MFQKVIYQTKAFCLQKNSKTLLYKHIFYYIVQISCLWLYKADYSIMYIVVQVRDVVDVPLVWIKQNNLQSEFQTLKKITNCATQIHWHLQIVRLNMFMGFFFKEWSGVSTGTSKNSHVIVHAENRGYRKPTARRYDLRYPYDD